jgi:gamma-glutamylcyclotransferase (GGCT)/AIG2-like uncharacterized protein YtfP
MLYAICAYEDTFGGLHGINSFAVVEGTEEDANIIAEQMSYDVMQSYALEDEDEDYNCEEHVAYEVYPFTEETFKSLNELNDEIYKDPQGFIEKYCNEKISDYF